MGNKCVNYVANERLAEEIISQIEILATWVEAETTNEGVCFHIQRGDVTVFECDHCKIRGRCNRYLAA